MKLAFVYAGQGSQKEGMGHDLYERYPVFRESFDAVDPDGRWRKLCFEGSAEDLEDTRNTQPCMVAFAVACTALLKDAGYSPEFVCGLSLGEYSSLAAAGVFEPAEAVELAAFRGAAMADASKGIPSKMAAILGMEAEPIQEACEKAQSKGIVSVANYNCPGQIVISGEERAVDYACELLQEAGAKRIIPLAVSGPFHTRLMKPAAQALHERFKTCDFHPMRIPVVFNATARPLEEGKSISEMLELQVQSSIHFDDSVRYMASQGVDTILEIGPGNALSKLVRKIDKGIERLTVEDVESFEASLQKLEEMA